MTCRWCANDITMRNLVGLDCIWHTSFACCLHPFRMTCHPDIVCTSSAPLQMTCHPHIVCTALHKTYWFPCSNCLTKMSTTVKNCSRYSRVWVPLEAPLLIDQNIGLLPLISLFCKMRTIAKVAIKTAKNWSRYLEVCGPSLLPPPLHSTPLSIWNPDYKQFHLIRTVFPSEIHRFFYTPSVEKKIKNIRKKKKHWSHDSN